MLLYILKKVIKLEYMTVHRAAEIWEISDRLVRVLCSEGKIPGVINLYSVRSRGLEEKRKRMLKK